MCINSALKYLTPKQFYKQKGTVRLKGLYNTMSY